MTISTVRNQREYNKFIEVGTGTSTSTPSSATAVNNLIWGKTATGTGLPLRVDYLGRLENIL